MLFASVVLCGWDYCVLSPWCLPSSVAAWLPGMPPSWIPFSLFFFWGGGFVFSVSWDSCFFYQATCLYSMSPWEYFLDPTSLISLVSFFLFYFALLCFWSFPFFDYFGWVWGVLFCLPTHFSLWMHFPIHGSHFPCSKCLKLNGFFLCKWPDCMTSWVGKCTKCIINLLGRNIFLFEVPKLALAYV